MNLPTEPTIDVPLSSAEIAGYMNWRGPGAYTIHAERRIRKLIAEAVRREREACATVCEGIGEAIHGPGREDSESYDCADAVRVRGQS